jgi:CRISPR-associated endonuclease/helicase Cas3
VAPDPHTPRRLIWCLPMRALVEQTARSVSASLEALGILDLKGAEGVSVHVLMGGEADLGSWAEHPDQDMILIGTQDMLLSRALMRGYGMSRYQWPVHFAFLHNDALWAFDEIQLMGSGLETSAQLEAFRRALPTGRPSRTLWLSATLDPKWLATVDFSKAARTLKILELDEADRAAAGSLLDAGKRLSNLGLSITANESSKGGEARYLQALCEAVLQRHRAQGQTLVIINRVGRAQKLFRLIRQARAGRADLLVHARFRPAERRDIERRLREELSVDRIVIATQAIEAGVDMTSSVLVTELAPWPSLVQRFGRCNRFGECPGPEGAAVLPNLLAMPRRELRDPARAQFPDLTMRHASDNPAISVTVAITPKPRRR